MRVRVFTVPVQVQSRSQEWTVEVDDYVSEPTGNTRYRLALQNPDGTTWEADEWDVFEGLLELRRQVESTGVAVCCNGSRRNAWASGMARQMGGGWIVYLLEEGQPATQRANTFDAAPPEDVVQVADQVAWVNAWFPS